LKKADVRFFVHAFQSKIFNEVLKEIDNEIDIPLPNFDLDTTTDIGKKVEEKLAKYDITKEDFILRSFPECIQETVFRKSLIEIEDFKISFEEEKGKYNAKVEFVLPKGSYATVIIEKLFGKS
jgi:tRNA(Glu) U13 pseudouridine synthase TruD